MAADDLIDLVSNSARHEHLYKINFNLEHNPFCLSLA
jgi:hypothetical protein